MSFITRCPACATAFKVVPDQLKISDGWVRCGQCQQVFNATLDLQPWSPGPEPAAPQPPQPSQQSAAQVHETVPEPESESRTTPASVPQPVVPPPSPAQTEPQEPDGPQEPQPEVQHQQASQVQPEVQCATVSQPHPTPGDAEPALVQQQPQPDPQHQPTDPQPRPAVDADAGAGASPLAHTAQTAPSFVRKAQRQALWRRPAVRLLLLVAVAALALLLGLQAATQWRAPLTRAVPATQPVLEALCQTLDCQQALPTNPNDVVIDSSVLLRLGPGMYGFHVVLRNQTALEVASPAIELTLTDIHDQVLVRRVLLPHEWPRPTASLPAGAEWSLQFELAFDGIEGRVMTGYRAILFYP